MIHWQEKGEGRDVLFYFSSNWSTVLATRGRKGLDFLQEIS